MPIPELTAVRLRSGRVEDIDRFGANEAWKPEAGLEGVVVHAYPHPHVGVYIVEILGPPDDPFPGRPLALLDVREEDLEVI